MKGGWACRKDVGGSPVGLACRKALRVAVSRRACDEETATGGKRRTRAGRLAAGGGLGESGLRVWGGGWVVVDEVWRGDDGG